MLQDLVAEDSIEDIRTERQGQGVTMHVRMTRPRSIQTDIPVDVREQVAVRLIAASDIQQPPPRKLRPPPDGLAKRAAGKPER